MDNICILNGCKTKQYSKKYCYTHYSNYKRIGKFHVMWNKHPYQKIMRQRQKTKNGCWEYTGCKRNSEGYGVIGIKGKSFPVHRYVYEYRYGKLKSNQLVLHLCDNPICCNPKHLIYGDNLKNMQHRKARTGYYEGENNCLSKLKKWQVIEIINSKDKPSILAQKYNVTYHTIYDVKTRKTWKHINKKIA